MNAEKKLELIAKLVNTQEDGELIELLQGAIDDAQERIKIRSDGPGPIIVMHPIYGPMTSYITPKYVGNDSEDYGVLKLNSMKP